MVEVGSRADDLHGRSSRGGGWREAFLNRHTQSRGSRGTVATDDDMGAPSGDGGLTARGSRARSLSRPRVPRESTAEANLNQQAVLDQDRALIEQLTQRTAAAQQTRAPVKKPPPPPKVTPYRQRSNSISAQGVEGLSAPPSPTAGSVVTSPEKAVAERSAQGHNRTADEAEVSSLDVTRLPSAAVYGDATASVEAPRHAVDQPLVSAGVAALAPAVAAPAPALPAPAPLEPVVPKSGQLFTASDIDSFFDRLGPAAPPVQSQATEVPVDVQCMQNSCDISQDYLRSHGMETSGWVPRENVGLTQPAPTLAPAPPAPREIQANDEFEVPQRRALKEQIQAIDSWLEDDFAAREQLGKQQQLPGGLASAQAVHSASANDAYATMKELSAAVADASGEGAEESVIIRKLEAVKAQKALGQKCSPVALKDVANKVKPLLPGLPLDKLVHVLRLFTSARHEDHDLYLRILGEIPVQIRGVTPEMLTTCVRVLWRLRLTEATYLELFSMEAMNMIRAKRKTAPRAPPRRPMAPRLQPVDTAATAAVSSGAVPTPTPPPPKTAEAPAPFSATQLVHIGNALSQLGAKPPTRFLDVYQEQLASAIPQLTQEECELISPPLAMSQLMPDALRRTFLERCGQVDAGSFPTPSGQQSSAAPDIAQYQLEAERRQRREKHFRNLYIIEASVRKETFSFFSSLPNDVRSFLDRLHGESCRLPHEGTNPLAAQVADVLDQLGVGCDLSRMAGPLGLHIVAKAANGSRQLEEIVYECSDATAYYAPRQDDRGAPPELTAYTKLRHRLLQRLGVKLTHIGIWEWQSLSEAQRVNYMVKLQSLQ